MVKKCFLVTIFLTINSFSQEYNQNFLGNEKNENINVTLEFQTDEEGKPLSEQKFDIRGLEHIKSLKVITASGLLGTLKDEREIIAYYKTNLNINGLKIRNLYKTAVARVYGEENNITLTFDPDHYQNIVSFLRYHNIKQDVIKDIDNLYGTWEEINLQTQEKIIDGGELK